MNDTLMSLQYRNEDDKAYGLAGMLISLSSLDAIDTISSVSMDTDGGMVKFTSSYYYCSSPAVSPKAVWEKMRQNFYFTSSMALANVFSRSVIRDNAPVSDELLNSIYKTMKEEGEDECSLEEDEVKACYNHILMKQRRLFGNPRLRPVVHDLARELSRRRSLSSLDLRDLLEALDIL
jgi:hypothetical protein